MTEVDLDRLAKLMGGQIIAKLPGPLHGAAGAAYAAGFFQSRMRHLREKEQQGSAGKGSIPLTDVAVNLPAFESLARISGQVNTSAGHVAATVLEAVLTKIHQPFQNYDQFVAALGGLDFNSGILSNPDASTKVATPQDPR